MHSPAQADAPMFEHLHPDIFRLFSGDARWLYAGLLEHLSTVVFDDGGIVPRVDVVEAIREFIEKEAYERAERNAADGTGSSDADDQGRDPAGDGALFGAGDAASRAQVAYARLVATGWLVEHRDRYRRLVDLDGAARLLLDLLLDLKAGRLRSYGGEVLQVLALLRAARDDADDQSESVRNAVRSARSFINHLRSVGSAMRKAENAVVGQRELKTMFKSFFEDFVAQHLIEDFKRLYTQTNPFRFRVKILDLAREMESDQLHLRRLGEAYAREGRASDAEHGVEIVAAELRQIQRLFREIDGHLEAIDDTSRRVETRIRNTVRYMDRIAETQTERLALAFRMLSETPHGADAQMPICGGRPPGGLPLGGQHLYQAAAKRQPPQRRAIRRPVRDPAVAAYEAALRDYYLRTIVTPSRVAAYLERVLSDREEIRASELPVTDLDDFFVFERLRTLNHIGEGVFADRWRITLLPGTIDNGWLSCPDFVITRLKEASDAA